MAGTTMPTRKPTQPVVRRPGRSAQRPRQMRHGHPAARASSGKPVNGRCGPGTRIPFLVVSPWAKRNHVDHDADLARPRWCASSRTTGCTAQRLGGGSFDATAGSIDGHVRLHRGGRNAPLLPRSARPARCEARLHAQVTRDPRVASLAPSPFVRRAERGRRPGRPSATRDRREPVSGAARAAAGGAAVGDGASSGGQIFFDPRLSASGKLPAPPATARTRLRAAERPARDARRPGAHAPRACAPCRR